MGHDGLIGRTERKKRHVLKHKSLGLCIRCSRKSKPNKTHCQYHLDMFKIRYIKSKGGKNGITKTKTRNNGRN